MATGTVNFSESSATTGTVLHANFAWSGTKWNNISGIYASCQIKNPAGSIISSYDEMNLSTSSKPLTATANVTGTWTAKLTIWVGTTGTVYNANITVTSPPPPPPPPGPSTYTLTVTTIPENCTCILPGYTTKLSDALGRVTFSGVAEGQYTLTVKKTGYLTKNQAVAVHGNMSFTVQLEQEIIVICTPGAVKCVGADLYECNSAGTAWALKQANSPTCKPQGTIPDFWTDPIGYIVGVVIAAWEGFTGYIAGTFKLLQKNIDNFLADFGTQLAVFIKDPVKKVTEWTQGLIPTLTKWWGDILAGVNTWWATTSKDVNKWIGDATRPLTSWLDSGFKNIGAWWDSTSSSVTKWINSAVVGLQAALDVTVSNVNKAFTTWAADAQKAIGTALSDFDKWRVQFIKDQDKRQDEWGKAVTGAITNWVAEQITGFLTDALKGLNDEFDTMKKEEKK